MACSPSDAAREDAAPFDAGPDENRIPIAEDGGIVDSGHDAESTYGLDCPTSAPSTVPASSPRILIIGSGYGNPDTPAIAAHLQSMLSADSAFTAPVVTAVTREAWDSDVNGGSSLMNYFYFPGDRANRLALLQQPWSYVVLLDWADIPAMSPEFYFEGVRVLGCSARAVGAKPVVLMPWSTMPDSPDLAEVTYRVANGTNSIVAPAGSAWAAAQLASTVAQGDDLFVAAASLYSTLTGKNAADTSYHPAGIPNDHATELAGVAFQTGVTETAKVHYQGPFRGTVEMRTLPAGGDFWFMASGTSSEQIWFDRMNEILPKAGLSPQGTSIVSTNPHKRFDDASLTTALPYFQEQQYNVVFARGYDIDGTAITSAGSQTDLQVQVWDRHDDGIPSDGAAAVATMEARLRTKYYEAKTRGLSMIPHHLMFAKLKTMRPSVSLLSDGTHATYPVGYGLATMSLVSRTGIRASTDGLDADTKLAAQLADETIRQLSTLSVSGTFVPDDPNTRPTAP